MMYMYSSQSSSISGYHYCYTCDTTLTVGGSMSRRSMYVPPGSSNVSQLLFSSLNCLMLCLVLCDIDYTFSHAVQVPTHPPPPSPNTHATSATTMLVSSWQ